MEKVFPIQSLPVTTFGKKNLKGKICLSPFQTLEISPSGDVGLCPCADWHPTKVGNLFSQNIQDILASPLSQRIRQSIIDGTYEYCDEKKCAVIKDDQLIPIEPIKEELEKCCQDPLSGQSLQIYIGGDLTCNLSCPSCRTNVYKNSEQDINKLTRLGETLKESLLGGRSEKYITVMISTSGEIFASPLLMGFMNSIESENFPNLDLHLQTNGLLAPKNWHKLGSVISRVKEITVTVDAATGETYEKLRRGGKWQDIQQALEWIAQKKKENGMKLHLRMVAQESNYREIPAFYQQSKNFGADIVEYCRLTDWKSYSPDEFKQHDVFSPSHPEYSEAMEMLDKIKSNQDVVLLGDLH